MPINDEIASQQWTRYQYLRDRGHLEFLNKADKCDKFFVGEQWTVEDLNALQLQRRPALTINKIISTLSTLFGEQIFNRTETIFRPSSGATPELAETLTKVYKQISQNNQLQWARSELFADGVIRSRGFLEVTLNFDNSMQGIIAINNLNSKNVVIDSDADEYDPDKWNDVFVTKWLTPQDVELAYSAEDAELLKSKDGSSFMYGYDSLERVRDRFGGPLPLAGYYGTKEPFGVRRNVRVLERQYRRLDKAQHFVDIETGDTRLIPTGWDRNRIALVIEKMGGKIGVIKKLTKRIRWTVTADNIVLHDEWSPYKHFSVVPYFPYFRYGRTVGLVENLLGPQELLNKTSSQELHVINTVANSGWKVKKGALVNMSIEELEQNGAQTGIVLELNDIADAEKITPNSTPTGLDRISYKAEEHIKTISNVSDSMQGFDREDVAAKAIQTKAQRGSVNHTKVMDNLERTDFILARNILDIIQEYYTEPRILHITHDDLLQEPEEVAVNMPDETTGEIENDLTIGEYGILISSQPYRDSLEDSQFDQVMAMREQGIHIDDDIVIENSRLQRKSEIVKRMKDAQNSPQAQEQQELQMRQLRAQVATQEADAQVKQADAQLKQAKTQREIAMIRQEDARIQIDAQGESPEAAAQEMAIERDKHEQTMNMKREEHEMDMAMKNDDRARAHEDHQVDTALKIDQHDHNKQMAEKAAANQNLQAALSNDDDEGEAKK